MTLTVKVFKNVLALLSERVIVPVVNLLLVVCIARYLGADGLGRYAFIVGFVAFFDILLDLGINTLIVREVARDYSAAGRYASKAVTLKLAVAPAVFGAIAVFMALYPQGRGDAPSFFLFAGAFVLFALSETFNALYKARERMNLAALMVFLRQLCLVSSVVAAMELGFGIPGIAAAYLCVGFGYLVINYLVYRHRVAKVELRLDRRFHEGLLDSSLPFITLGFFFMFFHRIDVVMTSMLAGDVQAGYFSASSKVVSSLILFSEALLMAIFPIISRYEQGADDKMGATLGKAFHLLALISFPMAAGLAMISGDVLGLLYGQEFLPASGALVVLSLTIPVAYLSTTLHFVAMARDMQKKGFVVVLVFLAALIPANLWLIGPYGAAGAAFATLGIMLCIFAGLGVMVFGSVGGGSALAEIIRPLAASLVMAVALHYVAPYGLAVKLAVGAAVYAAAILLIGGVNSQDRQYLSELREHFVSGGRA